MCLLSPPNPHSAVRLRRYSSPTSRWLLDIAPAPGPPRCRLRGTLLSVLLADKDLANGIACVQPADPLALAQLFGRGAMTATAGAQHDQVAWAVRLVGVHTGEHAVVDPGVSGDIADLTTRERPADCCGSVSLP